MKYTSYAMKNGIRSISCMYLSKLDFTAFEENIFLNFT